MVGSMGLGVPVLEALTQEDGFFYVKGLVVLWRWDCGLVFV